MQTIHEARIVHSDLKPANFLMVEGQLKLIDFGIAKAISSDTTSIARESQVGSAAPVRSLFLVFKSAKSALLSDQPLASLQPKDLVVRVIFWSQGPPEQTLPNMFHRMFLSSMMSLQVTDKHRA